MVAIDITNPRVLKALEAVGLPYWYGDATCPQTLKTPWLNDGKGYDCSGLAQGYLREIGDLAPDAWHDKTANDLANACDPVRIPNAMPGDLCFYGKPGGISHVTIYIGAGMTVGANGGTAKTHGKDPKACVQVRPLLYRSDLVVVGRIKPRYMPK